MMDIVRLGDMIDKKNLQRLGMLGLLLVAMMAVFYAVTRYQQKRANRIPLDDQNLK